jgi:hypothetical protein
VLFGDEGNGVAVGEFRPELFDLVLAPGATHGWWEHGAAKLPACTCSMAAAAVSSARCTVIRFMMVSLGNSAPVSGSEPWMSACNTLIAFETGWSF